MISIIIPVYNAAEYIVKCVDSVKKQSISEWELIIVDDGSSDSSGSLCDKMAEDDARIRVIHQKNQGVSAARNVGLDIALGEFVMFVDADDWLEPDLCRTLQAHMKKADVAISGFYYVKGRGRQENVFSHDILELSVGNQLSPYFDELYEKDLLNSPVGKLYSRALIGNQRFSVGTALGEDLLFNLSYFLKCKKMVIVRFAGYNYNLLNTASATKMYRQGDLHQVIFLYKQVKIFQKDIMGEGFKGIAAERKCCIDEMSSLQALFSSAINSRDRKRLTQSVFDNQIFQYCARKCTSLPLKYEIPRRLCLCRSYWGLFVFFWVKKRVRVLINI